MLMQMVVCKWYSETQLVKKIRANIVARCFGNLSYNLSLQKAENKQKNTLFQKTNCYKYGLSVLKKQFAVFPQNFLLSKDSRTQGLDCISRAPFFI